MADQAFLPRPTAQMFSGRPIRPFREIRGVSLIEIVVVVCLSSFILLGGSLILNRSTRSFKKGTEMMNTQMLMDNIIGRLRSDVRSLKRLQKCTDSQFSFLKIQDGTEVRVKYEYSSATRTLFRSEDQPRPIQTDFHGPGQVESFLFQSMPQSKEFAYLNVAMMLESDEKGEGNGSRLFFVCQFHPMCLEPKTPFGR